MRYQAALHAEVLEVSLLLADSSLVKLKTQTGCDSYRCKFLEKPYLYAR